MVPDCWPDPVSPPRRDGELAFLKQAGVPDMMGAITAGCPSMRTVIILAAGLMIFARWKFA